MVAWSDTVPSSHTCSNAASDLRDDHLGDGRGLGQVLRVAVAPAVDVDRHGAVEHVQVPGQLEGILADVGHRRRVSDLDTEVVLAGPAQEDGELPAGLLPLAVPVLLARLQAVLVDLGDVAP